MWGVQLTHVAAGTGTYITLNMLIFSRFTVRISRSKWRIARQVAPTRPAASMLASQPMGSASPMHTTAEPRAMASGSGVVPERWPQSRDPSTTGSPCTTAGSAMVRDLCSTPW